MGGGAVVAPRVLAYTAHWAAMTCVMLLLSNVQVTTRLVCAGCAPVHWYAAHLLREDTREEEAELAAGPRAQPHHARRLWLRLGGAAYGVCGILLHANNYPWT